jgi:Galactose oxidase, central domain
VDALPQRRIGQKEEICSMTSQPRLIRMIVLSAMVASLAFTQTALAADFTWTPEAIPSIDAPGSLRSHTTVYDPVRQRLLVFGGVVNLVKRADVWSIPTGDPASAVEIFPEGASPVPRAGHSAIYDPVRDRMILFGGATNGYENDTWVLSLSDPPTWTTLATAGTPPSPRGWHTAIYDPVGDRMIVFGKAVLPPYLDLWELTLAGTPTWTPLSPGGFADLPRMYHSAVYDPHEHRMLVFGGQSNNANENDVKVLSLSEPMTWSTLQVLGDRPDARTHHGAIYDPVRRSMVVFGGDGTDFSHYDVWELDPNGTLRWTERTPAGTHQGRIEHTFTYDPVRGTAIAIAGLQTLGTNSEFLSLDLQHAALSVPSGAGAELALHGVRPNPMRSSGGAVALSLADDQPAAIELIDVTGRRVWSRDVGALGAGRHTVTLPSDRGRKPGIYFLRLSSGNRSVTTKAVFTD